MWCSSCTVDWGKATWYELGNLGYALSISDPALFVKRGPDGMIYGLVHVDDLLLAAASLEQIKAAKAAIASCFEIRPLYSQQKRYVA